MSRTRIKICGITRVEDAHKAAMLGVDAIGLMFYPQSPRYVSLEKAVEIAKALPAMTDAVAVFVDPERDLVERVAEAIPSCLLQFHGEESPEFCASFKRPYIKAIRMQASVDLMVLEARYAGAAALLLDSHVQGMPGGTGQRFDWTLIPKQTNIPIMLAGGLNSDNVAQAISLVSPYAVDVSGAVELEKGLKDANKMTEFVEAVACRGELND